MTIYNRTGGRLLIVQRSKLYGLLFLIIRHVNATEFSGWSESADNIVDGISNAIIKAEQNTVIRAKVDDCELAKVNQCSAKHIKAEKNS